MISDVCSNSTTNKFENEVGMLNIAPTKISGQYKLVYDKNLKPWLDDYTGRRVAVDTSISFLQQVANFLSVSSFLPNTDCLRFGGFQRNLVKSLHIPFYFGTNPKLEYPKYFVLAQVPNETFEPKFYDNIYKYGILLKVVDLESIGFYNILNEINNEPYFDYPLYFNHEERKVQIFGFGIEQQYPCQYTLDLTKAYSNQTYIDVINNKILNAYADQKIFYPRFLNIEFEFDFDFNTEQEFNNFYGFLSNKNVYDKDELPKKSDLEPEKATGGYFIKSKIDKFVYDKQDQLGDYISDGNDIPNPDNPEGYKSKLESYNIIVNDGSVNEIAERTPQVRFRLSHLNVGDIIRIYKDFGNGYEIDFEYQVELKDTDFETFYQQAIYVCRKMTEQANLDYEFSCKLEKNGNVIFTCISNEEFDSVFETTSRIELPLHAVTLDSGVDFKGIGPNDVWLCGNQTLCENQNHLTINDILYRIVDTFTFNDDLIIRLVAESEYDLYLNGEYDNLTPPDVQKLTTAYILQEYKEECVWLKPINFLSYYSTVPSTLQGNFQQYVQSLIRTFAIYDAASDGYPRDIQDKNFLSAIESFSGEKWEDLIERNIAVKLPTSSNIVFNENVELPATTAKKELFLDIDDITVNIPIVSIENINYRNKQLYQYISNKNNNLEDSSNIEVLYHNEQIIKNLLFCSMGTTGYITPNILSIDRQFWLQNGCLDQEKGRADLLRYTWFLLAGQQPEYLEGKHWRYMDRIETENGFQYRPRITSRLIKITNNLCETIFLGVKYQLPIQYEDWDFAVYLNYNDSEYLNKPEFFAEVYTEEKLILISINKFIDFTDLIRGGSVTNQPILDLSFFLNIKSSYNNSSDYYIDFNETDLEGKKRTLILEPFYNMVDSSIMFDKKIVTDWIQEKNGIKYFCLRTNADNNLELNFKQGEDKTIFTTAEIEYNGKKFIYPSMKMTFKNIIELNHTYLWFEDLEVTFFDTREIFIHKYNDDKILKVTFDNLEKTNIVLPYEQPNKADRNSPYYDWHKIVTLITDSTQQKFELLLPSEITPYGERISRPISLKQDWFRITKKITENIDGSKNDPITNIEYIESSEIKDNYLARLEQDLIADISTYESSVNLFERNQIWYVIQDMIATNIVFKEYTEKQMYQELDKFAVDNIFNLPNKSIPIKNSNYSEFSDNFVVVNPYSIDKNYVIWDIYNNKKICKINRYNAPYIPFLPIQTDINNFQINQYNQYNTLWNLYDKQFGGYLENTDIPISGTTLWDEIQGNLISTLYCKNDPIILSTPYPTGTDRKIDYYELLKLVINYFKIIVTSDNHEYIKNLNKNVKPYIIETYANLLLSKFYKLSNVTDDDGMRIPYTIDTKKQYTIIVPDRYSLGVRFQDLQNVIIKLERK